MAWESLLGKSVKVVQGDGWIKFGQFLRVENGFVHLRFDDGRISTISVGSIVGIEERRGGGSYA